MQLFQKSKGCPQYLLILHFPGLFLNGEQTLSFQHPNRLLFGQLFIFDSDKPDF